MKKAALIVGARPQFIKIAPLILELGRFYRMVLIHTGQHYDFAMSDCFFDELKLPSPDFHLNIQSGSNGRGVGKMIDGLESVLNFEKPDFAIVVGDTNSTLAGAMAAARLRIPFIHIEAGVRSKDKHLPEQINRVVADSLADCFFCPTPSTVQNLKKEGRDHNVFDTGDVIYDCLRMFEKKIPAAPNIGMDLPSNFVLATLHRAEAVDNIENLSSVLRSLKTSPYPIVLPLHPRTRKMISRFNLERFLPEKIMILNPVGYIDLLSLLRSCRFVVSDSGGVQREAVFMKKRVILPRPETEWREFQESGWVTVAGYDFDLAKSLNEPSSDNLDILLRSAVSEMAARTRQIF